ncbi:MAG: hypothetical protein EOO52_07145 [Gammaproteobacteria bacterium]|nr:MAG: hypothetical protein EOO52_07145 [Gammaproteobacteria bacterium]
MNSSAVVNVCLVLAIMGLALDASANLINCNKASSKWSEPVTECEDSAAEFRSAFSFFTPASNSNAHWKNSESLLLTKEDLDSAQFVISSISGIQLSDLCNSKADCHRISGSLASYYAGGAAVRVSEPAPFFLVILGLLGLGLVRRRSR